MAVARDEDVLQLDVAKDDALSGGREVGEECNGVARVRGGVWEEGAGAMGREVVRRPTLEWRYSSARSISAMTTRAEVRVKWPTHRLRSPLAA